MAISWPRRCEGDIRFQPSRALGSRVKAGFGAFRLYDPVGNPLANGIAQRIKPAAKRAILCEEVFEFGGNDCDALFGVRFEEKFRCCAFGGMRAYLHFLVYEQ